MVPSGGRRGRLLVGYCWPLLLLGASAVHVRLPRPAECEGRGGSTGGEAPNGLFVTAASANHFQEVKGAIRTAQYWLPVGWKIVLFNLIGDWSTEQIEEARGWLDVEVRRLDSRKLKSRGYPDFQIIKRFLTTCDWKAMVIRDALDTVKPDLGMVVWGDASVRFDQTLAPYLLRAYKFGFAGKYTNGPLALYTHPDTYAELARIDSKVTHTGARDYMTAPVVCGCFHVWRNSNFVRQEILHPFEACSARPNCVHPANASGFLLHLDTRFGRCLPSLNGTCHRSDQSVLSTILYEKWGRLEEGASPNGEHEKSYVPYDCPAAIARTDRTSEEPIMAVQCG